MDFLINLSSSINSDSCNVYWVLVAANEEDSNSCVYFNPLFDDCHQYDKRTQKFVELTHHLCSKGYYIVNHLEYSITLN